MGDNSAMGRIIDKFLLVGDKFIPEMHLKQPGLNGTMFTYSACRPFTRHKERINKFMKTGDTRYIYRNDLDKACFQHDAAYSDSKGLTKRTASDRVLRDKAFNIASNPKYNGYERGLPSMVYKFFDEKSQGGNIRSTLYDESPLQSILSKDYEPYIVSLKSKSVKNTQLADKLHKPIIRKFKKRKVHSAYVDKIWAADLADMQLLGKKNKGIKYLLCVVDLFSRYAFVVPLKNKGVTIVETFQKILNETKRKPSKIWIDQGKEFYNKDFKKWLVDNGIKMYFTYTEGKLVIAERFTRTFKNKLYKHMTAISKDVYYNVLDNIVDEYNNTYHGSIKKKPIEVENSDYSGYVYEFD